MPGNRDHPLDRPLKAMVDAMLDADKQLATMAHGMGDFDSKQLSAEEDEQLFAKPAMRYLTEKNPQTGLPYTDPEAAQRLLEEMGPEQYVAYCKDFVRRYDRRQKDGGHANSNPDSSAMAVEPDRGLAEPAGLPSAGPGGPAPA